MYRHLLLHCQSSPPSTLLHPQSCNHIPYNPMFSCCHHHVAMLPPHSTDAATTAAVLPPPPQCCHTTAATLPPPLGCCHHCTCHVCHRVTTKLLPPPLPPHRHHCRYHRRRCQAATAATKLLPLLLLTLQDKFDSEKEFCNMTDIDCVWLSWLLWAGIKFLHGGMLPIFSALVYLSLYCYNLQSGQLNN